MVSDCLAIGRYAPNSAWLIAQDGKVKLSQLWFDGPTMDDAMAAMTA